MASSGEGEGVATISVDDVKLSEEVGGKDAKNTGFSYVALDEEKGPTMKKKKVPRRILHFSDGVLEEYSTDEEDDLPPPPPPVDPKTLTWMPWFWYKFVNFAVGTLGVADSCGERLAWFFGITSPKYQYAIDEYNKLQAEEEEERRREEREKEAERQRKLEEMAEMEGAAAVDSAYKGVQEKADQPATVEVTNNSTADTGKY